MGIVLEDTFELLTLLGSRADAHAAGTIVWRCRALAVIGGSVQRGIELLRIAVQAIVRREVMHWC